jgi:hypothetical protein
VIGLARAAAFRPGCQEGGGATPESFGMPLQEEGGTCIAWRRGLSTKQSSFNGTGFFSEIPFTQRKLTLDGDSEPFTGINNGVTLRRGGPISAYPR